jgi:ankyrin repeat protein
MPLTFRQLTESERDRESRRPGNIWGTPLHAAVHMGNPEKGDVYFAVKLDRVRVIKALLAHGAHINARIRTEEPRWIGERYRRPLTGATPFILAAKAADMEVMRLLLANGADPTIRTKNNTTALMAAAGIAWAANQDRASEREALAAVRLLVELGADVNAASDINETAMHGAAYRGANSIVTFLVEKGARIDVADSNGLTPLIIADGVEYGNGFAAQPHTAALLRQLGAGTRP